MTRRIAPAAPVVLLLILFALPALAAAPQPGTPLTIQKAAGPIQLDGDLNDAGWQGVTPITQWYETNVGDNVEPQVKNVAWLAYDGQFLYAAFQFDDPSPDKIRRPLGDHDAVSGSTDYGGVIVDSKNDGKTAQMFLANPSGVQYDAMSSDVSGEDNAPDFYWDSVGKVTATGWNLEIRIPFSSLRYSNEADPTWGMLLYRNYPRDRRYQFFSARLPRDVNCFICNSSKMTGLSDLPKGQHLVIAPFATAAKSDTAQLNTLGNPLTNHDVEPHGGFDLKWSPIANFAIDGTYKPDFSQIESDVAQIGANERFALFYPEKRTFFLEGIDLFSAPMRTVYTRTITAPEAGLRGTGRIGNTAVTALVTHDQGGGLVVIPGAQSSDFALQDFESDVGVFRVRHDLGQSFVSALSTVRTIDGGGHNTVFGPDFQWRPNPKDNFQGQFVWSDTRTPNRPDLATQWDGRTLFDHAFTANYGHGGRFFDFFLQGQDIGDDFRADDGFIPQVGYREVYLETGWTFRPKDDFFSRIRVFTVDWLDALPDNGQMLTRRWSVGTGADGKLNSFIRVELNKDDFLVGTEELSRFRPRIQVTAVPSRLFNNISIDTYFGDEVDFDNAREGTGTTVVTSLTVRPSRHLELRNDASRRALDVDDATLGTGRLFTAWIERLRGTWAFNARSFVRLIGQYVETTRDPSLYTFPIAAKDAGFGASGLFAYKLNWQTVAYLGYGDVRAFDEPSDKMQKATRQVFAKVSYAWQR